MGCRDPGSDGRGRIDGEIDGDGVGGVVDGVGGVEGGGDGVCAGMENRGGGDGGDGGANEVRVSECARNCAGCAESGGQRGAIDDGCGRRPVDSRSDLDCSNGAYAAIGSVGDVDVAGRVERDAPGQVQLRIGRRAVVAGVALHAVAGDGGDEAAGDNDLADGLIPSIGDVDVAGCVDEDASGTIQQGVGCRTAVAGVAPRAVAGDGIDDVVGDGNLADGLIVVIGDVDIARSVDRHAGWKIQLGADGCAAVAGVACRTISGHCGDDARRKDDLADDIVSRIRDVEVA